MSGDSINPQIEPGTYQHFKGGLYTTTGEILPDWSESAEGRWMVVYVTALGERGVRDYTEFTGTVTRNNETKPRFKKVLE